jgi:anti-sigma regulatory factor (Ser/Thr protein kinase)
MEQAHSSACRFVLSADEAAPGLVRGRIRQWLEAARWPDQELDDIEYALSEAATNAAEHAYPPAERGDIVIDAHIQALPTHVRRVQAVVRDHGRWQPQRSQDQYRGNGIVLMTQLMDELTVRPEIGGGGTEVTLISPPVPALAATLE